MSEAVPSQVTVLIVDDHAVVREGYRRLIERHEDIVVIGEAATAEEALALVDALAPQIVVMDVALPGRNGIDSIPFMLQRQPRMRVLTFSMHEETIFAKRALQAGAFGYVTKASAPQELVTAVRVLASGRKYVSAAMAQSLAISHAGSDSADIDSLSPRELKVLRLLLQGLSVKDIALSIGVNAKTVANHQSAIRQKLGVDTAFQLLQKAKQMGLPARIDIG